MPGGHEGDRGEKRARGFGPLPLRLLAIPLGVIVVVLVFLVSKLFPSVPQTPLALLFAFAVAIAFAFGFPRRKS